MAKSKVKNQQTVATLSGTTTASYSIQPSDGIVVATTIPSEGVRLIKRYAASVTADLKAFVRASVADSLSWMRRMTNGPEMFELNTLDYWTYNELNNTIELNNPGGQLRDFQVIFDCGFCKEDIDVFNRGVGLILSSHWYQTTFKPLVVVELIAAFDLLYREFHNGTSPAVAAGIPTVRIKAVSDK